MNPSYNSGGIGSAGASSTNGTNGGIYSSGATQPISSNASERSNMPIASAPVLMPMKGKSGKPKVGIVVGIILIIVALVLGIVAVMMMPRGENSNSSNVVMADASFYEYANYLLYGNDSTDAVSGEYDITAEYAVMTAYDEENSSYFNTLRTAWNSFYDSIKNDSRIAEDSIFMADLQWQNELMDYLIKYVAIDDWSDEDLLAIYLENENALSQIENNYDAAATTIYQPGADYVNAKLEYAKATMEILKAYNAASCITDGVIDEVCVEENEEAMSGVMAAYAEKVAAVEDAYVEIEDVITMLIQNCYEVQKDLTDETTWAGNEVLDLPSETDEDDADDSESADDSENIDEGENE